MIQSYIYRTNTSTHRIHGCVIGIAVLSLALLSSCSSGSDIDDNPVTPTPSHNDRAIGFNGYISRTLTRGTSYDVDKLSQDGFGIFAQYTNGTRATAQTFDPQFMNNLQVTSADKSTWTYSPLRYWPNSKDEYVSFLAYAPYQTSNPLVAKTTATGSATTPKTYIHYVPENNNPESNVDWMYNTIDAFNQQIYTNGTTTTKTDGVDDSYRVRLQFKHATARLAFAITSSQLAKASNFDTGATSSNATITINRFVIGKYNTASSDDDPDDEPGAKHNPFPSTRAEGGNTTTSASDIKMQGVFYGGGYLNVDPSATDAGQWSDIDDKNLVLYGFEGTGETKIYSGSLNTAASEGNLWNPVAKESANEQNVITATRTAGSTGDGTVNAVGNSASDYLFIIPQTFEAGDTTAVTAGVYGVESGGGPTVKNTNALNCYINYTVTTSSGQSVNFEAYGSIGRNYEAGKAYLILVDIVRTSESDAASTYSKIRFAVTESD